MSGDTLHHVIRWNVEQRSRCSTVSAGSSGLIATFLLRFLCVFASDEPCNGQEIHRASARFYALQTAIN